MNNPKADAFFELVNEKRGLFAISGIALLVLGIAAVSMPHVFTVSTEQLVGWVLAIAGIIQLFHAFSAKGAGGFIWQVLIGILQTGVGLSLVAYPDNGIITLTVLLATMLIGEGIVRSFYAFSLQPNPVWGWVLASGLVSLALGVMVFAKMPGSATWAIGLLVGCNIAMAGWVLLVAVATSKKH